MAKMKDYYIEFNDLIDQLDNQAIKRILLLVLLELETWTQNDKVISIVRGHTDMLQNRFVHLINAEINKINKGEEK
tara:strand:+ start:112 stop:339 length:228 start_codon:yes stop_codon:yes gene_type:complete